MWRMPEGVLSSPPTSFVTPNTLLLRFAVNALETSAAKELLPSPVSVRALSVGQPHFRDPAASFFFSPLLLSVFDRRQNHPLLFFYFLLDTSCFALVCAALSSSDVAPHLALKEEEETTSSSTVLCLSSSFVSFRFVSFPCCHRFFFAQ